MSNFPPDTLALLCFQEPGKIRPSFKPGLRKSGLRKCMTVSLPSYLFHTLASAVVLSRKGFYDR